jgi:threonine dehydrogenase-like Zn-dependent dehydrogenase
MALGAAGIALSATLAGAVVTSILEGRRDAARRAHADQVEETKRQHEAAVRFHNERLNAHVEYISAVSALFAIASVWIDNGATGSFSIYAGQQNALSRYSKAITRVTMLAKSELIAKINEVHSYVQRLVSNHAPEAMKQIVDESLNARAAFETAAKKELGIG